ncbi:MAG: MCE family protein [Mycobacterium sp.]|nr:MAG: MCE family protein [Mycobacterium sp.]PJE24701.1 MAG: MCE family protein [Mycobacterium sp.]
MLPRLVKVQLGVFTALTILATVILGWYYLRVPTLMGIGQYRLYADLPRSGGLYPTANVTYRGATIGKVIAVKPTVNGARATMSIDSRYRIPLDSSANVHSVSAIGEQYLDLVSPSGADRYFRDGQTITKSTVPTEIGPAIDAANKGLAALPKEKIDLLLTETAQAVGGLGPALQRLVTATTNITDDFANNLAPVTDIIGHSGPLLDSQVNSGDAIQQWSRDFDILAAQTAGQDQTLRSLLQQAAPTADAVTRVFNDVRDALPQTLANLEVVIDMLKRYHKGLEQTLVLVPQAASIAQAVVAPYPKAAALDFVLTVNQPPPCLTGFLPASQWRSPADTSDAQIPPSLYCKIPKDTPSNGVRGARNYPCADVPGKRAATPDECRSDKPYEPLGTNPWYGDPNQLLTCPAPAARCDQPVKPGLVVPAPSIDSGLNPLPADQLPAPPVPTSDPLTRPGQGSVQCNGQQPNPCLYTPVSAVYLPASHTVVGPDGVRYDVNNSAGSGDDGWQQMLSPPH